jgi:hypothetical protein
MSAMAALKPLRPGLEKKAAHLTTSPFAWLFDLVADQFITLY